MRLVVRVIKCLIILVIPLLVGCGNKENTQDVVITIDDEVSYLSEALVYLDRVEKDFESIGGTDIWDIEFDGKSAEEVAKERTIENMIKMKIMSMKARDLGIELTDEEKEAVKTQAITDWQQYTADEIESKGITEELLINLYTENTLALKVYDAMTKEYELDEDQIQEALDNNTDYVAYKEIDPMELLKKAKIRYIYIQDENGGLDKAQKMLQRIESGEDFATLMANYSTAEQESFIVSQQSEYPYEKVAFDLEIGEISDIITTEDGYYIVQLLEWVMPTEEEINDYYNDFNAYEAQLISQYSLLQKDEAFNEQYEEWKENYTIKINTDLWEKIKVSKAVEE